jgi:hypothetical protein
MCDISYSYATPDCVGSSGYFRDLTRSTTLPIDQCKLSKKHEKTTSNNTVYVHQREKLKLLSAAIIATKRSPFDTIQTENLDQFNIPGLCLGLTILAPETCLKKSTNESRWQKKYQAQLERNVPYGRV